MRRHGGATAGLDSFCARRRRKSAVGAEESLRRGRTKERAVRLRSDLQSVLVGVAMIPPLDHDPGRNFMARKNGHGRFLKHGCREPEMIRTSDLCLRSHRTGSLKGGLSRNDGYAGRDTDPGPRRERWTWRLRLIEISLRRATRFFSGSKVPSPCRVPQLLNVTPGRGRPRHSYSTCCFIHASCAGVRWRRSDAP